MSKSSKKRKADARRERKKSVKAQRRALYASYAGTGRKKKKVSAKTGRTSQRGNHVMADCGNVGCQQCYPRLKLARAG